METCPSCNHLTLDASGICHACGRGVRPPDQFRVGGGAGPRTIEPVNAAQDATPPRNSAGSANGSK